MTVDEVNAMVALLASDHADNGAAHETEDGIHQTVLRSIAAGACQDPIGCASAALKTLDLDFGRWFD